MPANANRRAERAAIGPLGPFIRALPAAPGEAADYQLTTAVCPCCAEDGVLAPLFWPVPGVPQEAPGPWDTDFSTAPIPQHAMQEVGTYVASRNPTRDVCQAMEERARTWADQWPAEWRSSATCERGAWKGLHKIFDRFAASRRCPCRGPRADAFAQECLRLHGEALEIRPLPRDAKPSFGLPEALVGRAFLRGRKPDARGGGRTKKTPAGDGKRDEPAPGPASPVALDLGDCPEAAAALGEPTSCGGCLCPRFPGTTVVCPGTKGCQARKKTSWAKPGKADVCTCHSTRHAAATDPVRLIQQLVSRLAASGSEDGVVRWNLDGLAQEAAAAGGAEGRFADILEKWDKLASSDDAYAGASTDLLWEWLSPGVPPPAPAVRDTRDRAPGRDPNVHERARPARTGREALELQSLYPPLAACAEQQECVRSPRLVSARTKVLCFLLTRAGVRPQHWTTPEADRPAEDAAPSYYPYSTTRCDGRRKTWKEEADEAEQRGHRELIMRMEEEGLHRVGWGVCRRCNAASVIPPPYDWRHSPPGGCARWDLQGGKRRGRRPKGWFCGHCKEPGCNKGTRNTEFKLFGDSLRTPKRQAAALAAVRFLNRGLTAAQVDEGGRGLRPTPAAPETDGGAASSGEAEQPPRKKARVQEEGQEAATGPAAAGEDEPMPQAGPEPPQPDAEGNWMRLRDPQLEDALRQRNQGGVVQVAPGPEGDAELRYPSRKFGDIPINPFSQLTDLQRFVCNLSDAERQVVARIKVHGVMVRVGIRHGGPVYKGGTVTLFTLPQVVGGRQGSFPTLPQKNVGFCVIRYQKGWCTATNEPTFHPSLIFRPTVVCLFLAFMAEYGDPAVWGADAEGRDPEAFRQIQDWSEQWGKRDLQVRLDDLAGRGPATYNLLGDPKQRPGPEVDLEPISVIRDVATAARTSCVSREDLAHLLDRGAKEISEEDHQDGETGGPPAPELGESFRAAKLLARRAMRKCKTKPGEARTAETFAQYYCTLGRRWHRNKCDAHEDMSDPRGCPHDYLWHTALRLAATDQRAGTQPRGDLTEEELDALKRDLVQEIEQLRAERLARGEEVLPGEEGGGVDGTTGGGGIGEPEADGSELPKAVHAGKGARLEYWEDRHDSFCTRAFPDLYLWGMGDPFRRAEYSVRPASPEPASSSSDPPPPPPEVRERSIRMIKECTGQPGSVAMVKHFSLLLRQSDGRFLHHLHQYWAFAYQQKLDLWAHARLFLQSNEASGWNDMSAPLTAGDPNLHRKLRSEAQKIRGVGKGDPTEGEEKLRQTSMEIGSPAWFFTMSAFDHNHPLHQWVALQAAIAAGDEPPTTETADLGGAQRRRYAMRHAYHVNDAILHFVYCYLNLYLLPHLGAIRAEVVFEFQHRGAPHIHALVWCPGWAQMPPAARLRRDDPEGGVELDPDFARWHDHYIEQRLISDKFAPARSIPWAKHIPDQVDPTRFGCAELVRAAESAGEVYNEKEDLAALQIRCMQHTCKLGKCLSHDSRECRADFPMPLRAASAMCKVGRKRRIKVMARCNKVDLMATCPGALLACRSNCNLQVCTEEEATMRYVVKYMRKKEPHGRALVDDADALRKLEERRKRFNLDEGGVVRAALRQSNAGREYTIQETAWWLANHPISFAAHNLPPGTRPPRKLEYVSTRGGGDKHYIKYTGLRTYANFDRWVILSDAAIQASEESPEEVRGLSYSTFRRRHKTSVRPPLSFEEAHNQV